MAKNIVLRASFSKMLPFAVSGEDVKKGRRVLQKGWAPYPQNSSPYAAIQGKRKARGRVEYPFERCFNNFLKMSWKI